MAFADFLRREIEDAKQRYAYSVVNMDGTLVVLSINVCGRVYCLLPREMVGIPDTDGVPGSLLFHFLETTLLNTGQNIAFKTLEFDDSHHLLECFFKATALALNALNHNSHYCRFIDVQKLCDDNQSERTDNAKRDRHTPM